MIKILGYLLFLFAYVMTAWLYGRLFKIRSPRTKRSLWVQEARPLIYSSALYIYILLLARFSSFLIVGFYFLSSQVPILLNVAINASAVGTAGRDEAEMNWAGICFANRHRRLSVVQWLASIVLFIIYPILMGIVYFSNTIPSTAATLAIIRVSLLVLFVSGLAIFLPNQVAASASENLSTPARRRIFGVSLAALLPSGVLLTTLLWTFSSSSKVTAHSNASFHFTYSPIILAILAAYFVATLLLPYIVGILRGAAWQRELLELRTLVLARVVRVLRTPKADYHVPALSELSAKLQQEYATFVAADKSIEFGLYLDRLEVRETQTATVVNSSPSNAGEGGGRDVALLTDSAHVLPPPPPADEVVEGGGRDVALLTDSAHVLTDSAHVLPPPPPADEIALYEALRKNFDDRQYYLARPRDPRFQYLDWIDLMVEQLQMTISDLRTRSPTDLGAAKDWADCYEQDRRDLTERASQAKRNAVGAVFASTAVTTVVIVLFTSFGSWLWSYASHALPK